jgi:glycosyltransferase involved in cell wall biosynthesis
MFVVGNSIVMLVRAMSGGGAQRDAIELANGLWAAGWPMVIATLDVEGPLATMRHPAVPLIDLGQGKKLRMAAALGRLKSMMMELAPSAVIASEAAANCLLVSAALRLPAARRPRIVLREVAVPLLARRGDPYPQNRLAYRLAPYAYPRADRVLSFTDGVRQELIAHFRVTPERAVNLGTNAVLSAARLAQLAEPYPRDPALVVAVGRLSPEKDFAALISAFADLPGRLVIIGEGPERPRLERLIARLGLAPRVELPGFRSDPETVVRRAALFVSASRHEGFGNAIVEALACGTPVVATDVPHGPRSILADGQFGLLVRPGDPQALAEAIRVGLTTPVDRSALRARAADFTTEAAVRRFGAMLGDLGLTALQSQGEPAC